MTQANILQGVVTGVGFIGAGAIMRQGEVTPATRPAASIRTVGIVGAAVGFGCFEIGVILAVANLVVLKLKAPLAGARIAAPVLNGGQDEGED